MSILKESEKETTKLLATGLNTLAVNVGVVGAVTPLVAFLYNMTSAPTLDRLVPPLLVWPFVGGVLHYIARLVLKDLDL